MVQVQDEEQKERDTSQECLFFYVRKRVGTASSDRLTSFDKSLYISIKFRIASTKGHKRTEKALYCFLGKRIINKDLPVYIFLPGLDPESHPIQIIHRACLRRDNASIHLTLPCNANQHKTTKEQREFQHKQLYINK